MLYAHNDGYLGRYVDRELDALTPSLGAAAVEGPKGVGKTETAARRVERVYCLDDDEQRLIFMATPKKIVDEESSILIDEWQRVPSSWDMVRRAVDKRLEAIRLLTGSASPISGVDTHSGAGRIFSIRMRPFALSERASTQPTVFIEDLFNGKSEVGGETGFTLHDYAHEICASGFPGIQRLPDRGRRAALAAYVQRIVDQDIVEMGKKVRRPQTLTAWLRSYAAATGTTATYTEILDLATVGEKDKPTRVTTQTYRDLLTKLWILDPLPAWTPAFSPFKRLKTGVKHYLADPALSATLLGLTPQSLVNPQAQNGKAFGHLFEALAALTVRGAGGVCEANAYHFQTQNGLHEVDILLENYEGHVIAFEVKLKAAIDDRDVKHLHWMKEKLGDRLIDQVVITTGSVAYRRADGVAVVPLALLG